MAVRIGAAGDGDDKHGAVLVGARGRHFLSCDAPSGLRLPFSPFGVGLGKALAPILTEDHGP